MNTRNSTPTHFVVISVLATLSAFTPNAYAASLTETPPNVIVIYSDDQGYGDASCLNPNSKFETPNLDRLAEEGIAFTNAHSPDTVCTPSRYGLLTGRYCWRTTKKTGVMGAEGACLIKDGRMTLASLLRDQGYSTGMVGKWHLGMEFPGESTDRDWSLPVLDMPLDKGFEYFYGVPASLNYGILAWFEGRHAKVPPTVFTNKKKNKRHSDYRIKPPYQATAKATQEALGKNGMEVAADFIDNQCLTRFTDQAIAWMGKQASAATNPTEPKPFFLYLPLTSPHYPVCPLPEFWGQGDCGGYGEFLIETDFHVGRILKFLAQSGLDENTLIIFTSDNGPEKTWRQRIDKFGHHSNGPYRGGKRDIYEGGHRVPFFLRWPGGISHPGRTCDDLVGQIDLLATIAELTESTLPANAGEDSYSFAQLLGSPNVEHQRPALVNHGSNGRFSITDASRSGGSWKWIAKHGKAQAELYDLAGDPSESMNVLDDHPNVAKSLQQQLTNIVRNGRTTEGAKQPNDTAHWKDLTWMTAEEYGQE